MPDLPATAAAPATGWHARDLLESTLDAWVPRSADVAVFDVPVNRNAGDLFILAVTERVLADRGCRTVYQASMRDYRPGQARRRIGRDVILVGLGGGNFGDLYPRYQDLRERVAADFPRNRLVVLPQTIHFRSEDAIARTAARLSVCQDLRIAVRDRPSLAVARQFTGCVALLPDIVHALGPAVLSEARRLAAGTGAVPVLTRGGTIHLRRTDIERTSTFRPGGDPAVDWPAILPGLARGLAVTAGLLPVLPALLTTRLQRAWSARAFQLFVRAVLALGRADRVVTDRLHGAIAARLAGRPVTILDNSYGKLSAYYDVWWREDPGVELADPA